MPLYRAHSSANLKPDEKIFSNPYKSVPRRPLTMPQKMHEICGTWFKDRFGIDFRSHAIFCTGDKSQAEKYLGPNSTLIEVNPVGDFKACYSERVRDLFDHLIDSNIIGFQKSHEEIFHHLDSLGYMLINNQGLDIAEVSGCEIMLFADSFSFKTL